MQPGKQREYCGFVGWIKTWFSCGIPGIEGTANTFFTISDKIFFIG